MMTNSIDKTAFVHPRIKLGEFNRIGKNVRIDVLNDSEDLILEIGDNNIVNDNTRILISGDFTCGDWNVFHNDMLVLPEKYVHIGHNCWFGQNTILDGAGGLRIGNGVRIGMYSQIWTHVASGEQIEGCTLFAHRSTVIEDDVWLVGSCVVGSGLKLGRRSTILINSVVTKDTEEDRGYAGNPAKLMEKAQFYLPKTNEEKFEMLSKWLEEFVKLNGNLYKIENSGEQLILRNIETSESVLFTKRFSEECCELNQSVFFLGDKKFNKTNSSTERAIYKFLYNNKARFLPIQN